MKEPMKKKARNPFNLALIQARTHANWTPSKREKQIKNERKMKCKGWE